MLPAGQTRGVVFLVAVMPISVTPEEAEAAMKLGTSEGKLLLSNAPPGAQGFEWFDKTNFRRFMPIVVAAEQAEAALDLGTSAVQHLRSREEVHQDVQPKLLRLGVGLSTVATGAGF